MDIKIQIQSTPNPNALKFILNTTVKTEGKASYKSEAECESNPLAKALFNLDNVHEVYFFDNYITITQDGEGDWDEIEDKVQKIIMDGIEAHNPDFKVEEPKKEAIKPADDNPEIVKINAILDETVRPALQMDGGDLVVAGLESNILSVNYQGACGGCPSASSGTLKAIENILRDQYNPNIVVEEV